MVHDTGSNSDEATQYNVLVVTHAALLRVFLQRLIGADRLQQHPDVVYKFDNNDTGIPINNRLDIPNASYTKLRIDIVQDHVHPPSSQESTDTVVPLIQRVEIERFTSTDHYQYIIP
jgi:broad specificity phosphatase PhoE